MQFGMGTRFTQILCILIAFLATGFFGSLRSQEIPLPQRDTVRALVLPVNKSLLQIKIPTFRRPVRTSDPLLTLYDQSVAEVPLRYAKLPTNWERLNEFSLNLSEAAFVNWNAGGENAVSGTTRLLFKRYNAYQNVSWKNELELRFGMNVQEDRAWRKTDDAIRLASTFGYRRDTISNWYYSAKAVFQTQFADGFNYPDRSQPISRFMAPGYLFIGAGASYITKDKSFDLYISPFTHRSTFVLDQDLANAGAFGVRKAVLDEDGNVVREGSRLFTSLGFQLTHNWESRLMKNVDFDHRLNLYTDYLRDFGNVDIDWEIEFILTVNRIIKTRLGTQLIYDDDIRFDIVRDTDGTIIDAGVPRVQFRQWLNIGVNFEF